MLRPLAVFFFAKIERNTKTEANACVLVSIDGAYML